MKNDFFINSIQIRNFRSIKNEYIETKDLNIFVGMNDTGKSNVLKALNLFFNGDTDYKSSLDFEKDFSYFYSDSSHKKKEISITVKFNIPDSYTEKGVIVWNKKWRANNDVEETITNSNGDKLSDRSRVQTTLKRIKYRYVPAVKSKEFYKSLLSDLYYTVSSVLNSPLESSVNGFSEVIRDYTAQISDEVSKRVGIDSMLSIPENLSELFRALVFKTKDEKSNHEIPLDLRGDGIQARHIPIILKYIADEDQKTRNQGSMKVHTIWGFEEPENGVELSRAFSMAKDFVDYSNNIQMFITTHSPAFYTISSSEKANVIYVSKDNNEGSKLRSTTNSIVIGEYMGLMPLVAPYIAREEEKVRELQQSIKSDALLDRPTIFVEGKLDKKYLELAIKLYSPILYGKISDSTIRIFSKENEGGCRRLVSYGKAWVLAKNHSKAFIIFDKDDAGIESYNELNSSDIFRNNNGIIKSSYLKPSNEITEIYSKGINIKYELEHLLSNDFWEDYDNLGLLEQRSSNEILSMLNKEFYSIDTSPKDAILQLLGNNILLGRIVMYAPAEDKKERIIKLLLKSDETRQYKYMIGFKAMVDTLERYFITNLR